MKHFKRIRKIFPDKMYLQMVYHSHFHKFINFSNPVTFNEKLQWLKLNDRRPEYTTMVDKHLAKEYVASKIGAEYIIPTLGVWEKAEDIDFDMLPDQFVLKCNNDSGGLVICKDKSKLDKAAALRILSTKLNRNGFWYGREWPYKNVKPCIIAEKYMEDTKTGELSDYKIHVFDGKAKFVLVCRDRYKESGLTETFFTTDWKRMRMKRPDLATCKEEIPRPALLDKMLELSEVLAKDIPFVRVDFYEVDNKLYFGELTLYPASGFKGFEPEKWDVEFGKYINLKR